jgi:DNA-binding response OmpR family regulator
VLLVEDDASLSIELAALLCLWGAHARLVREADALGSILDDENREGVSLVIMAAEFGGNTGGDWMAELSRRPSWSRVPVITTTRTPNSIFACALRTAKVPVLCKPVGEAALNRTLAMLGFQRGSPPPPELARTASLCLNSIKHCRSSDSLLAKSRAWPMLFGNELSYFRNTGG